jgi:hypothetical protein
MPCSHFIKNTPPLQMPRTGGKPDSAGARYEGAVLNGEISVQEAHYRDAVEVTRAQLAEKHRRGDFANCYVAPENYDPVLCYHLRVGKPYYHDPDLKK